jgi:hypothetical protein
MEKFTTSVEGYFIKGTINFKLTQTLLFKSEVLGKTVIVFTGFITNFASIPRFLLWYINTSSPEIRDAAVVHDYLYVNKLGTRLNADKVLREGMLELGASKTKAYLAFLAVRLFGGGHWGEKIV